MQLRIKHRFPILIRIVRDILYIPTVSIGYERDFSIIRYQIRYNRLYKADTFSNIIQVRYRLRDKAIDRLVLEVAIGELFINRESGIRVKDPIGEERELDKSLIDSITRIDSISDDEKDRSRRLIASNIPINDRLSTKLRKEKKRERELFDEEIDRLQADSLSTRPRKSRRRNSRRATQINNYSRYL